MALSLNDPKTQKRLLTVVAPILLLIGYWYFFQRPAQEEIGKMKSRLEQLEGRNAAARARAQGGPELEKKLALYEEQILQLEKLVPLSEEVPELLYDLSLRAQEHGVELARMKPNDETPGAYYSLQTYDIAVFGSYHDIGRYLAAVGSLPRIVTVYDLKIEPRQERDRSGTIRLQADFRIKTYVLPSAAPVAS